MPHTLQTRIQQLIGQMTIAEKVGQLFMMAYTEQDIEYAKTLIKDYHIGGFYISNDNADNHADALKMTQQLSLEAQKRVCDAPLILGVDQEGSWSVLAKTSVSGPGNLALGVTGDSQLTENIYGMFAKEMACAGYTTILAPCGDVNSNIHNPIIGVRAFGEDVQTVTAQTRAAVLGLKKQKILSTVKHFPGHGDTAEDTHRKLPRVDKSLAELESCDLVPFQAAIDAGVDIVMTAHILYPQIDDTYPATLSSKILSGILRKKMGFQGIILTDSMNMWAMRKNYDPAQAAIMALKAGANIVMLSEEVYENNLGGYKQKQQQTIQGVIHAVEDGTLPESIINESLALVLQYRYGKCMPNPPTELDTSAYGNKDHLALARKAAEKAVKVIRNTAGAWPLQGGDFYLVGTSNPACQNKILQCRGIGPNDEKLVIDVLMQQLDANGTPYTHIDYAHIDDFLNQGTLNQGMGDDKPIVLITENYPIAGYDHDVVEQADIIKKFMKKYGDKIIVVALRSPYELEQFEGLQTYICAHSSRPVSVQVIGDMLSGQ